MKNKKRKRKRSRKKTVRINVWIISAICLMLLAAIIWPYIKGGINKEHGSKVPEGNYCYGIDISHYQKDIVWDSLKVMTDGSRRTIHSTLHAKDIRPVSFVFIKATEGASMKDKLFKSHWEAARKSGLRRGAYHFFRSSKDPELQARSFIRTVGRLEKDDLPPVLDIEIMHAGCSKATLNKRAKIWLKAVERHYGRKPVIYSSAYFIRDILDKEIKENYPIWVAHYEKESPLCKDWHLWQFCEKGLVYGIEGYVDINVCRPETLRKL